MRAGADPENSEKGGRKNFGESATSLHITTMTGILELTLVD